MAGTRQACPAGKPAARNRLKRGRKAHWQALEKARVISATSAGRAREQGRWLLRRYVGARRYRLETLGLADDSAAADRAYPVLQEAEAEPVALSASRGDLRLHVRMAWDAYIAAKRHGGQPVEDLLSRGAVHILPDLGDLVVEKLTAQKLRQWLSSMAAMPAQSRPKNGKPQYKTAPANADDIRARRATANRV